MTASIKLKPKRFHNPLIPIPPSSHCLTHRYEELRPFVTNDRKGRWNSGVYALV